MKFPMLPARVALAVVGAAILTAIGCTAIPWQPPPPISIAVATSLTGLSGAAGAESLFATKLYVDEVNRSGGVNGHPIELVLFDDTSNPEVGRDNVQTIADSPCVAVLGHLLIPTRAKANSFWSFRTGARHVHRLPRLGQ